MKGKVQREQRSLTGGNLDDLQPPQPHLEFESFSEMHEWVERSGKSYVVLGRNAEAPTKFYAFLSEGSVGEPLIVAIVSSHFGIEPKLILDNGGQVIAVGWDRHVALISLPEKRTSRTIELLGAFFDFIMLPNDDGLIAMHELGALRLSYSGDVLWSVETDVVARWNVEDNRTLVMELMDSRLRVAVNLQTGSRS
jgi:hypothetical protein